MIPILSLLTIVSLSILVTRIAAVALSHTGLSMESARFQARSAFTGVGFTTSESEKLVNHPVRRKILLLLMLLGNAGIVTAVSSLLLTGLEFEKSSSGFSNILILFLGLFVLWTIASSRWIDRKLSQIISWSLGRFTNLEVTDYANLLHLTGDYRVTELEVQKSDWIAEKKLSESKLRDEGVVVLGIKRPNGPFLGAPDGETFVNSGDVLVLYGRYEAIEDIDSRRKGKHGDIEHLQAISEQQIIEEQELIEDKPLMASEQKGQKVVSQT